MEIGEIHQAVERAFEEWASDHAPTARASLEQAGATWTALLRHLIGHRAAAQYAYALERVIETMDRLECVNARLSVKDKLDSADKDLLQALMREELEALRAFGRVDSQVIARLDRLSKKA